MIAVLLALSAALLYAVASVLQHRAARTTSSEHSLKIGLLARLVVKPSWVIGLAADGLGYVCQFAALDRGSLVLVQPLLVSGMFFALPLSSWLSGATLRARDWFGAACVCGGLGLFLVAASPAQGHPSTSSPKWLAIALGVGAVIALCVLGARTGVGRRRAACLGAAAGTLYGFAAALTKTSAWLLGQGISPLLTHWQPYALIVAGVLGMVLAQSAFQAGPLDASLPALTIADPAASIAIGALGFGESIAVGIGPHLLQVSGIAIGVVGVWVLGHSTVVLANHEPAERRRSGSAG